MSHGGFTTRWEGLAFINSPKRTRWTGPYRQIFRDLDGSLTGMLGGTATPFRQYNLWEPVCSVSPPVDVPGLGGVAVSALDGGIACNAAVQVRKVLVDAVDPGSLDWATMGVASDAGTGEARFKPKPAYGWTVVLVNQRTYTLTLGTDVDWQSIRVRYAHEPYVNEGVEAGLAAGVADGTVTPMPPPPSALSPAVRLWQRDDQGAVAAAGDAPEWLGLSFPFADARWEYAVTHNKAGVANLAPAPAGGVPGLPRPWHTIGSGFTEHTAPPSLQPGAWHVMLSTVNATSDHATEGVHDGDAFASDADRFEFAAKPVQVCVGVCVGV